MLYHQHERSRCCHKAWLGFPTEDMRGMGTEARDLRAKESVEEEGGGGEKEEEGERLQTSEDGVGVGEGRKGGERSDREKKKMQPPKIKSKDCIRSEQRCRNRWQLRISEFASPFLIHELE